ncbi:hypothetical protein WA158_004309 [Blastocystis sp. Blastoise]
MKFPGQLIIVYLTVFIDSIGFSFVIPTLPYIIKDLGGSATELGYTASIYALTQAISKESLFILVIHCDLGAVALGALSDKFGRRPYLILSLFGSWTGPLLQALSPNLALFIVTRAYTGLLGGSQTIGQAYIADIIPADERSKYLGHTTALVATSFVIGPFLGGLLSAVNMRFPYYVASGCALIVNICAVISLKETNKDVIDRNRVKKEKKRLIRQVKSKKNTEEEEKKQIEQCDKELKDIQDRSKGEKKEKIHFDMGIWLGMLFRFFNDSICCLFSTMYGQFIMEELGGSSLDYSLIFAVTGVFTIIVQVYLFPLFHNKLHIPFLWIAVFAGLIGFILMAYIQILWFSYISCTFMFIGFSFMAPISPSLLSIHGPKDNQGGVLSIGVLAGQVATILVPTVEGYVYDASPVICFLSGGCFGLAIAIIASISLCLPGAKTLEPKEQDKEKVDKNNNKKEDISTVIDVEKNSPTHPISDVTENENQSISVIPTSTISPSTPAVIVDSIPQETEEVKSDN